MWASFIVVNHPSVQGFPQVPLVQRDHEIQALTAHRSDQSLAICIRLGRSNGRAQHVLQQPEEAWFDVNMMQKDTVLAMDLGRQLDVPLPSTAVSNEILTAARGMGWARYDFACMFDVLAAMSGVATPVTAAGRKK